MAAHHTTQSAVLEYVTSNMVVPKPYRYDFDLFTIGGGSGGVRGSRWAAMQYGAKVGVGVRVPL